MEDSEKNKLLAQNEIQEIQRQANGWNFNKPVNPYREFFQEVVGIKKAATSTRNCTGVCSVD